MTDTRSLSLSAAGQGSAAPRLVLSLVLLGLCSCSSLNRSAASKDDPFLDEPQTKIATAAQAKTRRGPAPAMAARPAPSRGRDSAIRQAGYDEHVAPRRMSDSAIERTNAESRMPLACPPCNQACPDVEGSYPDEYLCDGGDRDYPVHYDHDRMLGLETEDTVLEYVDENGRRRVKPSTKVCIYAPRFASVMSIDGPIEDVVDGRPTEAISRLHDAGMINREVANAHEQRDMTERFVSRVRGSGLVTDTSTNTFDRPVSIAANEHTTVVLENFGFLRTGQMLGSEKAWIAERRQAAVVWTRDQNPVIAAETEQAGEVRATFTAADLTGQENRFKGKSRLRIVKLADRDEALPGDIVTFTIRFDNIGDQEVRDVVIVDNLTPRLEYVNDSGTLDLPGRLVTESNGEGSEILRWELDEPLPGRKGGVATFQARVR